MNNAVPGRTESLEMVVFAAGIATTSAEPAAGINGAFRPGSSSVRPSGPGRSHLHRLMRKYGVKRQAGRQA